MEVSRVGDASPGRHFNPPGTFGVVDAAANVRASLYA